MIQNHWEIDITESILVSRKVVTEGFPNDIIDIMAASLTGVDITILALDGLVPILFWFSDS